MAETDPDLQIELGPQRIIPTETVEDVGRVAIEVNLGVGEELPDQETPGLPSKELGRLLEARFQENFGGERASTCIPNALAVAGARASGSPGVRPERGIADLMIKKGAISRDGFNYDLREVGNALDGNLPMDVLVLRDGAGRPIQEMADQTLIESVLGNYGAVVFADATPGKPPHAGALIGIRESNGAKQYLMYDGAPKEGIGDLPIAEETLRWVDPEDFARIAANQQAGVDMKGIVLQRTVSDSEVTLH